MELDKNQKETETLSIINLLTEKFEK